MPTDPQPTTVAALAKAAERAARSSDNASDGSEELLAEATLVFVRAFDAWARRAALAAGGDTLPRLRLLYTLATEGPQRMADLAAHLEVTPRNITALVDGLEAANMVRRTAHPTDRRVTLVEIVDRTGAAELQMDVLRASVADLFTGVDPDDRDAFERVLATVLPRLG